MFKKWLAGFLIAMMVVQPLEVYADKTSVSEDIIIEDTIIEENVGSSISNIANPCIVSDSSMTAGQKVTYDCIWFGSYPQAEVIPDKSQYTAVGSGYLEDGDIIENASLYNQLQSATYNSKNETTIGGTRYRRMLKSDATYATSRSGYYYNWSDSTTYHYFKYEPIKWRVIEKDSSTAFLFADKGIDDQRYNETTTSVTWETCTLRDYLNSTFYDNAFNTTEKGMIIKSTVENADNLYFGISGGNNTSDNVFLLAEKEVYKTCGDKSFADSSAAVHGFVDSDSKNDEARRARSTTYAKAMGTWWNTSSSYKGNCWWWSRSPGYSSSYATYVDYDGYVNGYGSYVGYDNYAVRPALKINLSSLTDSMYAGTVCSDGTVNETAKPGDGGGSETPTPAPSPTVHTSEGARFTIFKNKKKSADAENSYSLASAVNLTTATGDTYLSNSNGIIDIKKTITYPITITSSGYVKRVLTKERIKNSKNIYLQQDEKNTPVISGVWVDDNDVLNNDYYINMLSDKATDFEIEVAYNGGKLREIKLEQNGRSKSFTNEKFSTVLSENFDTSEPIYIVVTDSNNVSTKKPLKIKNVSEGKVPDGLDGFKFEMADCKKFTLPDSIPFIGGMDAKFGNYCAIPVTIEVEDGKVYAAIGIDAAKYGWDSNKPQSDKDNGKIKGIVSNLKETFKEKDEKKFSEKWGKKIKEYKGNLKNNKSSFAVDGDLNIMGFAEGVLPEDGNPLHIKWLDTGVVFDLSGSMSHSYPFSIWVIPCYVKGELSGNVTSKLNIVLSEQAKNFEPYGSVDGKIQLKIGAGAGFDGILNAEFGGKGALMPQWLIRLKEKDYFKIDGSANFYVKVQMLFLSKTHDFPGLSGTLWESDNSSVNTVTENNDVYVSAQKDLYDSEDYDLIDISYLDDTYIDEAFVCDADDSTVIKDNIYRESEIQYVEMSNGKKMAIFTNAEDADYNHLALYYSIYNGTSWSIPQQIENDGTADFSPRAISYNGDVYVVWQNLTKTFTDMDNIEVDDIAAYTDISVAKYNGSSFAVTDFTLAGFDAMPQIYVDSSNATLAWINKASGTAFGTDSAVYISEYDGSKWSTPVKKYSVDGRVDSLAINNGDVAYVRINENADGTIKNELYENGSVVLVSGENASRVSYYNGNLYWLENGVIKNKLTLEATGFISGSDYKLFDIDGRLAAIFSSQDDLKRSVYISYFNDKDNSWDIPSVIYESEDTVNAYAILQNNDGGMDIVYSSKKITGSSIKDEPYGNARLVHGEIKGEVKAVITDAFCDESQFIEGETLQMYTTLENSGMIVANNLSVSLLDNAGNELALEKLGRNLVPGDKETVTLDFEVSDIQKQSALKLVLKNDDDIIDSKTVNLHNNNIKVNKVTYGVNDDEKLVIVADIINAGNDSSNGVKISLRKDSTEGQVIDTKSSGNIEKGSFYVAEFVIDNAGDGAYYVCIEDEDCNMGDNYDFVYYGIVGQGDSNDSAKYTRKKVAGYTIEYTSSVSYNGVSHIEKGGKTSKTKTGDIKITLYDPSGKVISPDRYKVSFKNNKNAYDAKNRRPYFNIKLKDKVDKSIKAAFKATNMYFEIKLCDISSLKLSSGTLKETKNGYKLSNLSYISASGKVIKLKQANNKGKGDFTIEVDGSGKLKLKGIGNYSGTYIYK